MHFKKDHGTESGVEETEESVSKDEEDDPNFSLSRARKTTIVDHHQTFLGDVGSLIKLTECLKVLIVLVCQEPIPVSVRMSTRKGVCVCLCVYGLVQRCMTRDFEDIT